MPKLPADLPENWTRGQIVSPNGTETGLTEQHGYNYLMKQVNDTQTEVNGINEALPDVAQQATVEEINNKIGTESDADTQPTLFGRLAQLKKVLLEKLTELMTKVTGIDGKIGTSGDTAGTATLFGQIKTIVDTLAGKKYRYSDTVQHTEDKEYSIYGNTNFDGYKSVVLYNFTAEYDGAVHISAYFDLAKGNGANAGTLCAISEEYWNPNGAYSTSDYLEIEKCLLLATGTELKKNFITGGPDNSGSNISKHVNYGHTGEVHLCVPCKKGGKVSVVASLYAIQGATSKVRNFKLMYDLK